MNTPYASPAEVFDAERPARAVPRQRRVLIWDAPVRVFHWLMVLSFAGAYITAESERWRLVHVSLGYTLAGLVALPEALADAVFVTALSARRRDLGPPLGQPREMAGRLLAEAAGGPVALVFGNEAVGLSNDEIQQCHATVTIPANPEFSSLNLGAAVQLLCYELRMQAFAGLPPAGDPVVTPFVSPPATHEEVEGLYAHLASVMTETGFLNPEQPGRLLPKLRRLFGRARLEKDEINILRGILSATQSRTGHGRKG